MHVPPGLQGTAQWGSVWLVERPDELMRDLSEHERLLRLALVAKEAAFLRSQERGIMRLVEIKARLEALADARIPVTTEIPDDQTITTFTPFDSLAAHVTITTRPASEAEHGEVIEGLRSALKDSAIVIRGRMYDAVKDLIQLRSDQKGRLLADADGIVAEHRVRSVRVQLDGEYFMDDIAVGDYGLYGRYVLNQWFVLTPVAIPGGTVQHDVPRLSTLVSESRVVSSLDALTNRIDRY